MRVTSSKYPSLNIDGVVQFRDGVADVVDPEVLARLRALDVKHGVNVETPQFTQGGLGDGSSASQTVTAAKPEPVLTPEQSAAFVTAGSGSTGNSTGPHVHAEVGHDSDQSQGDSDSGEAPDATDQNGAQPLGDVTTEETSNGDDQDQGSAQGLEVPKGNASREVWAEYATARGITVADEMKAGEIKTAVAALDEA